MLKARITRIALEKAKTVYGVILLLVLLCTAMIPTLNIDTDPENMLPADDPLRQFHNEVKQRFAMHDMIVVGAVNDAESGIYNPQSLQAMNQLSINILDIDGVIRADLMALNTVDNITQEGLGSIRFEWLMRDAPTTLEQAAGIKAAVSRLPMLANTLVSDDGKAAAIYVPVTSKDESYRIAEEIRDLIKQLTTNDQYYITGLPVAEDQFGVEMFVQMGIAAPMAGLAIFLLMWLFFRSIPLVVGPMIVAMATVLMTMGLLIGMGFRVHIMSSMIAIFLMPVAVVDSTHILSEFSDRYKPGKNARQVITEVMDHLFTPMLYTSITSTVGFLSLMLTPIPPVKVFGAFVGGGIFLAFVLTVFFIPAYIARMKPEALADMQSKIHRSQEGGRLARGLPVLGRLPMQFARPVLLVFAGVFVVSLLGVSKIQVNDNPVNWFKESHEIRQADSVLNRHFAGTYDAWLVLEQTENSGNNFPSDVTKIIEQAERKGVILSKLQSFMSDPEKLSQQIDDQLFDAESDEVIWLEQLQAVTDQFQEQQRTFQSPEVLFYMAQLQDYLLGSGLVGKVNGLPDIVKTVYRELQEGKEQNFRLPESSRGIAQTLLQYQSSHRPHDLWHFVTPDYRSSLFWLQLTSGDNQHMSKVVTLVDEYIAENPLPKGLSYGWAGKTYLNVVWQEAMVNGMLKSLLSSFVVVFAMMVLLFRSLKYGVLAMLPLTFTITMIYGLIGWLGKDYDMPIAVLSALTLGLSIDFAIHFLERFREINRSKNNIREALAVMFDEPGRAISRNAIVIAVGFTPLLLAPLVPYITVGFFMAGIMAVSALVTLVLLPASIKIFS